MLIEEGVFFFLLHVNLEQIPRTICGCEKKKHDLIFFSCCKKTKKDIKYPTFGGPIESLCRHNFIERFVLASNPE